MTRTFCVIFISNAAVPMVKACRFIFSRSFLERTSGRVNMDQKPLNQIIVTLYTVELMDFIVI